MTRPSTTINYPDAVLLRPNLAKWFRLMLGAVVFTLGGRWMISRGEAMGWFVFLFFGACFIVGVVSCLPGAAGLVVMREGFGLRSLFRTRFYPWHEVDGFGVYELRNHGTKSATLVGFNCHGNCKPRGAALSAALVGFNAGLPETYGLSAEELAAAMNAYRQASINDKKSVLPAK